MANEETKKTTEAEQIRKKIIAEFDNADKETIIEEYEIARALLEKTANIVDVLYIQSKDTELTSLRWEYELALNEIVSCRAEIKSAYNTLTEQMRRLNIEP